MLDKNQYTPFFLVFDCLLLDEKHILMHLNFEERMKAAHLSMKPYRTSRYYHKQSGSTIEEPQNCIDLYCKEIFEVSATGDLLNKIIPNLPHENDGIIFNMNKMPYYPGTC